MRQHTFRDDPAAPGTRVWRSSPWAVIGSGICVVLFALLALGQTAVAVNMLATGDATEIGAALVFLALTAIIAALTRVVWRDMLGKRSASIALTPAGISLDLRAGRSSTNPTDEVHALVMYHDVRAIETRVEAYPSLGMAKMVRTFRLVRHRAPPLFLLEERGLGMFDDGIMTPLIDEIARRASVRIVDRGIVEGGGGLLATWFTSTPDWSAPPVSAARAGQLLAMVMRTNRLPSGDI